MCSLATTHYFDAEGNCYLMTGEILMGLARSLLGDVGHGIKDVYFASPLLDLESNMMSSGNPGA